jgi:hypothetical protein
MATDFTGAGLSGASRDAAVALTKLFESYGLGSLAPRILDYIKQGYSGDTVSVLLVDTPEYKKRFAANEVRTKNGLPALSPAEYLSTESAYRQVMQNAGVPKGFYDSPSDFQKWLEDDVSPTEIKSRVDAATDFINSADQNTVNEFKKFYTKGDMIAFALDQKRAAPLVGKAFEAAKIAGAADNQNVGVTQQQAEQLAGLGISRDQAQQGFGIVASEQPNANKLASLSNEQGFTTDDLIGAVFQSDAGVNDRMKRLGQQEKGRFSGSSGIGQGSLSQNSSGL